jgi:hypothetical protein
MIRKDGNSMFKKIIAISICLLAASGILIAQKNNINKSQIEITNNVPEANHDAIGGPEITFYAREYMFGYYGLAGPFGEYVDQNELDKWANDFKHVNLNGKREAKDLNIYTFIKEFNISKEKFIEINYSVIYPPFTDEQIDALYSEDQEEFDRVLKNPDALYLNGKIYTPQWIETHSAENYAEAGITEQMLVDLEQQWKESGELFRYDSKVLKNKIDSLEKINKKE